MLSVSSVHFSLLLVLKVQCICCHLVVQLCQHENVFLTLGNLTSVLTSNSWINIWLNNSCYSNTLDTASFPQQQSQVASWKVEKKQTNNWYRISIWKESVITIIRCNCFCEKYRVHIFYLCGKQEKHRNKPPLSFHLWDNTN